MNIRYGSTRVAFVGEDTTIKVPKISLVTQYCRNARFFLGSRKLCQLFLKHIFDDEDADMSLRWPIQGFLANRRETHYSDQLRGVVVPTRQMLGGVFAIQPTVPDIPEYSQNDDEYWAIGRAIGGGNFEKGIGIILGMHAGHTFAHRQNYGVLDDTIVLRDFASPAAISILLRYRDPIRRELKKLFHGF